MFAKGDAKQLGCGSSCNVAMEAIRRSSRPRHPREVLLVVGGWSGKEPTSSSEAFDPATKVWSNTKSAFHKLLEVMVAIASSTYSSEYVFRLLVLSVITFAGNTAWCLHIWIFKADSGFVTG